MRQKKMAAPCRNMTCRSLLRLVACYGRSAAASTAVRQLSGGAVRRGTSQKKAPSPWRLSAAVYLQRLPVVSAEVSPLEQRFGDMLRQIELEKSLLADHEIRLLEDADRLRRMQSDQYDSDEEDGRQHETVLGQDMEDIWEQNLKDFIPAPRVQGDMDADLTSVKRCLADPLLLLAEQQVGDQKLWLLPQAEWKQGETLRRTAERALASLPDAGFQATFIGNTPCGVYKYKLPQALRTEQCIGIKLFFFRAILSNKSPAPAPSASLLWLRKSELQSYLKPAYQQKVDRFVL